MTFSTICAILKNQIYSDNVFVPCAKLSANEHKEFCFLCPICERNRQNLPPTRQLGQKQVNPREIPFSSIKGEKQGNQNRMESGSGICPLSTLALLLLLDLASAVLNLRRLVRISYRHCYHLLYYSTWARVIRDLAGQYFLCWSREGIRGRFTLDYLKA